jgi:hypothetical protein
MLKPVVFFVTAALLILPSVTFADTKVLVVGDSHATGTFKDGLLRVLDAQADLRTAVYASCGSRPRDWFADAASKFVTTCGFFERDFVGAGKIAKSAPTPDFEKLVVEKKPEFVVVAMGTNQFGDSIPGAKASIVRMIRAAKAGGANCIWVGPPKVAAKNFTAKMKADFQAMLEKTAREEGCHLIDSRPYTNPADTEKQMHIHYPGEAGRHWGREIGGEILTQIRQRGPTGGNPPSSATENSSTGN